MTTPAHYAWALVAATALTGVGAYASSAHAEQERTVQWSDGWPRVHLVEVGVIVALASGAIAINGAPYADHAHWSGPILFDTPARNFFKSNSAKTQEFAAVASDYLYYGMVLAPFVIDNYIVALGIHQNADVALQMTLIDLQSLALSGVMTLAAEHGVGRERPYVRDCGPGLNPPDRVGFNHCDRGFTDFQSFYSGHAAAAFTAAGLTCVHHQHLPLYGGGAADVVACATTGALATTTGILRLVSDRHYASDVLVGTVIGIINGYLLPSWLHYGFGDSRKKVPTVIKTSFGYVAPMPQVYQGGGGMGLAGIF
jgi:membrane-associated phospholipid phosphatase